MTNLVSRLLWGNWPPLQFQPLVANREIIRKDSTMFSSHARVLSLLCSSPYEQLEAPRKAMKIFERSSIVLIGGTVAFEAAVWKYFDPASHPHLKILCRIALIAGSVFLVCRTWGAMAPIRQVFQIVQDRAEFFKNKEKSLLKTQILHPLEAEDIAMERDPAFKTWVEKISRTPDADTLSADDLESQVDKFFYDPPFHTASRPSAKILNRSVVPAPIIQSYKTFSGNLKSERARLFALLESYQSIAVQDALDYFPVIGKALEDEDEKYRNLACLPLFSGECQELLQRIEKGEEKTAINKHLYEQIQAWAAAVVTYQNSKEWTSHIEHQISVQARTLPETTFNKDVGEKYEKWKEAALKVNAKEKYQQFIEDLYTQILEDQD